MELKFHLLSSSSMNSSSIQRTWVHGTQVPWIYFILFYKSHFTITWLFKNRVLHLKLDFWKIKFQNKVISLNSFRRGILQKSLAEMGKTQFWPALPLLVLRLSSSTFFFFFWPLVLLIYNLYPTPKKKFNIFTG